jgi:sec-independent protein translocase protein TatA
MNYVLLLGLPSGGELIFIVFIIVMLFGSKKIPELARGLGKGMREIKNATNDIQQEIKEGARQMNNAKEFTSVEKQVKNLMKDDEQKVEQKEQTEKVEPKSKPEDVSARRPNIPEIKPVEHPGSVKRGIETSTSPAQENSSEES